jgi:feruloyl esterase
MVLIPVGALAQAGKPAGLPSNPPNKVIAASDCSAEKLGTTIPASSIGLPVSAVTLNPPEWRPEANGNPAYCSIEGSMAPVDKSPSAKPIRFGVALPASWSFRATQLGGGGMDGSIPQLSAGLGRGGVSLLARGFATYGSDSGHQAGGRGPGPGRPGGPPPVGPPPAAPSLASNDWATNDEAIANLGYMQLKKTHDAAMVLIERMYGARPRFNYFFGTSQGGREALTVVQRFPADYDGVAAEVPIVSF